MNPAFYGQNEQNQDYIDQKEKVRRLYAQPLRPQWTELAKGVLDKHKKNEVLDEVIRQNEAAAENDPALKENLERIEKGKTLFVVSGQQLGMTVSPLYVIYKALTAVKLAAKLDKELNGYTVLPMFWLEGEDHDFEEVAKMALWDEKNELRRWQLEEDTRHKGYSLNRREVPEEIKAVLDEIENSLQETDFKAELLQKLRDAWQPGKNWLQAFSELLHYILRGSGLLHFNNGSTSIKQSSRDFFAGTLAENDAMCAAFREQSQKVQDAGYDNQVHFLEDRAWLFVSYQGGGREALLRREDGFRLKDHDKAFSQSDMLKMLDENPQWFSSTVLTRPLWQSYLLPTISYVAGPAEVAYWAQLKPAFDLFGLEMPHIQPRHSVTLLEPKTERLLEKYDLDVMEIPADVEEFLQDYFSKRAYSGLTRLFDEYNRMAGETQEKLSAFVDEIDPTMQKPLEKTFQSMQHNLEKFQGRLLQRVEEKEKQTQKHLRALHEALLPGNAPQERVLGAVYFFNKYGRGFIETLQQQLNMENFSKHQCVQL